ncbi:MAG: transposase [Dermatophilaceae bacterium]
MNSISHSPGVLSLVGNSADTGVAQGRPDADPRPHVNARPLVDARSDLAVSRRAVRLVQAHAADHGSVPRACAEVATMLGVSRADVRCWMREADTAARAESRRQPLYDDSRDELAVLRDEVARLQEENAALRAFTSFLSGSARTRSA